MQIYVKTDNDSQLCVLKVYVCKIVFQVKKNYKNEFQCNSLKAFFVRIQC